MPVERRLQVLAALQRVVQRGGVAAATVPAVVAEAGVAQGTFYRCFASLDDALLQLVRSSLERVGRAVRALVRGLPGTHDRPAVETALLAFYGVLARELAANGVALREALLVAPSGNGPFGSEMAAFLGTMRAGVRRAIVRVAGRPPFRALDPDVASAAVIGMVLGAAREAAELGARFDPARWAAEMARLEANAVTDRDPPTGAPAPRRQHGG